MKLRHRFHEKGGALFRGGAHSNKYGTLIVYDQDLYGGRGSGSDGVRSYYWRRCLKWVIKESLQKQFKKGVGKSTHCR